ncbi:transcription termination/antitermination NusG family protein [Brevundimonas sp.]
MLTWYLAAVSTPAHRKALIALKEKRFTVFAPMLTRWKSVPKGPRVTEEHPMFPGYVFIGLGPWNDFDELYSIPTVRVILTPWPKDRMAAMVADLAFRQCAGEFDKTGGQHYVPPKPMTGPLATTLGKDMSDLQKLLTKDEHGRLQLLFSGALVDGEPVVEEMAA